MIKMLRCSANHVLLASLKTRVEPESAAVIAVYCGAEIRGVRNTEDAPGDALLSTLSYLDPVGRFLRCGLLAARRLFGVTISFSASNQTRGVSSNRLQIPCVKSPSLERVGDFGNSSVCAPPRITEKVKHVARGCRQKPAGSTVVQG